jgi:hypothetical protein
MPEAAPQDSYPTPVATCRPLTNMCPEEFASGGALAMLRRWAGMPPPATGCQGRRWRKQRKAMRPEIPAPRCASTTQRGVGQTCCAAKVLQYGTGYSNRRTRNVDAAPTPRWRPHSRWFGGLILAGIGTAFLVGCGSGLTGPARPGTSPLTFPASVQCADNGLASQDLSGQCRSQPTTMGALEATAGSNPSATLQLLQRVN